MRLLVITSCTGEKSVSHTDQLTLDDFRQGLEHIHTREQSFSELLTPAEQLYTGMQHERLMQGVNEVRLAKKFDLDLWILSAGYGLVPAERKLAPYEATFIGMKKADARAWAEQLSIADDVRQVIAKPYDLGLILLGDDYLDACAFDNSLVLGGPTIVFCGKGASKKLPQIENLIPVILSNAEANRFSCALIGLKGELASRLLRKIIADSTEVSKLISAKDKLIDLIDATSSSNVKSVRQAARANPHVDKVIELPESWSNKPHRTKLRYFIPEWDDLVDPDYDFESDIHSGGGGDWSNEVYAHQMYPEPNYDGILVSKVVAEKSKKKKERINALGVHRYLRLPREFPIMGDCGAFGYIMQEVPPYSTEEILDYYTRLDFDFGVSVDHLIVTATEAKKQERYQLTINNAEEFLKEHQKQGLSWTPIGAVQGWDPKSYADAARQYVAMGYNYIALGGLVRSSTQDILRVLDEVHKVVPEHVNMHLFGIARLNAMQDFARLGVRSVDSASYLRRAWMGSGGQNYLSEKGFFTAIRIPAAAKSFRAKRMVSEGRASLKQVEQLEAASLKAMHDFDRGKISAEKALDTLMDYDQLITPDRPDNRALLLKTLEAAPWKDCSCDICQRDGIDVIIFRGNNRNRRRGFHNTFVFYRLLQQVLSGEKVDLLRIGEDDTSVQLSLFPESEEFA
jgi:hypothetical protein